MTAEHVSVGHGADLGASHQTGWTGVVARLMHLLATVTPEQALQEGRNSYFAMADGADLVGSSAGR